MFGALIALTVTTAIGAQSFDYFSVLDAYARDARPAVDAITSPGISKSALEDNVAACLPRRVSFVGDVSPCKGPRRFLAVMLHTEAAVRLDAVDDALSLFHLQLALRLLPHVEQEPAVTMQWYHFGVMFLLSRGDVRSSGQLADAAAARYLEQAVPHYLRGVVKEVSAMFDFDDLRSQSAERRLDLAVRDYERALRIDGSLVDARLRWGRIRALRGRGEGDAALASVAATAPLPSTRYLALLFLGASADQRGELDPALRHYEAAQALQPTGQAACVAVSNVLHRRGERASASTTAHTCLEAASNEDAWWNYRVGAYDVGMLDELRERAIKAQ
jgi:tetratricopeptide (TPR) repeat protein